MFPPPRVIHLGGRLLTVEDTGPESGFPILVHSGGGSRHLAPAAVREAGPHRFRLISYDRPSYGGSTPMPGRVVADCGADVEAVLGELDITRIAVWGFSGGGPYALATAALLPDAVAAVCVFAPLGPYGAAGLDFLEGMDDSYREEVRIFFATGQRRGTSSGLRQRRCSDACRLAARIPHVTPHFPEHEDHTNVEDNNRTAAYAWLRGLEL